MASLHREMMGRNLWPQVAEKPAVAAEVIPEAVASDTVEVVRVLMNVKKGFAKVVPRTKAVLELVKGCQGCQPLTRCCHFVSMRSSWSRKSRQSLAAPVIVLFLKCFELWSSSKSERLRPLLAYGQEWGFVGFVGVGVICA